MRGATPVGIQVQHFLGLSVPYYGVVFVDWTWATMEFGRLTLLFTQGRFIREFQGLEPGAKGGDWVVLPHNWIAAI
jgi:hypothetical protein